MAKWFQRLFGKEAKSKQKKTEQKEIAQKRTEQKKIAQKRTEQNKIGQKEIAQNQQIKVLSEIPEIYPFTQWVTFGKNIFNKEEKANVEFVDKKTGRRKTIVDAEGRIIDFPGIVKEKEWLEYLESEEAMKPVVRFRTSFETYENRYLMLWEIQPDGRYWEDEDGFGGTSDAEITLYTFLDNQGNFTQPFRVYKVGARRYLGS